MEVVKLLEEEGRIGRLWLIDSSPEFLKTITKLSFISSGDQYENDLQVKIILRFLDLIWPEVSSEVFSQLMSFQWQIQFKKVGRYNLENCVPFFSDFRSTVQT